MAQIERLNPTDLNISNEQLRLLVEEKQIFGSKRQIEVDNRDALGNDVYWADVLIILGVDRGLWNEYGHEPQSAKRIIDFDYSRKCVELAVKLSQRERPLLVSLILELKHGVRHIDSGSLCEIERILHDVSLEEVGDVYDEILAWRIQTLKTALATVLLSRRKYD